MKGHHRWTRLAVAAWALLGTGVVTAQETVAVEAAELLADFLLRGVVANAVNMAALDELADHDRPWFELVDELFGSRRTQPSNAR